MSVSLVLKAPAFVSSGVSEVAEIDESSVISVHLVRVEIWKSHLKLVGVGVWDVLSVEPQS